jgi:hypothetical protein
LVIEFFELTKTLITENRFSLLLLLAGICQCSVMEGWIM